MHTIKQLYPPLLIIMILFVQIIAFFINQELYNFRELLILFCWIPLLTSQYVFFKKKFIYRMVVFVFFLEGFLGLCHWVIIKGPLSATSLFVIFNTNFNETKEFLELKLNIRMFLIVPYIFIFIIAIIKTPEIKHSQNGKFIIIAILLFSIIFLTENIINGRLIRKGVPQTSKALICFAQELKTYNALKKRKIQKVESNKEYKDNQIFVLIIGESCSRNHMSLYNYKRLTNPKLEKRKDIIVFNNVISPTSNTLSSLLLSLTESNLENRKNFDESISLIDIFHSAGYKTYWISNQSPIGIWDNAVYNIAQTSDYIEFLNNDGNSSFENTYLRSYDSKILEPIREVFEEDIANKFIVIHLMGSHSSYSKRYPELFNVFKNGTSNKTELINEYDNSILYNDFIVDSLLNILKSYSNENPEIITSAIYFSDHGENIYDESDNIGHDYSGNIPKANVDIPFIVWVSSKFIQNDSIKYNSITSATNVPFVSDDLFHSIIDLNNINCSYFDMKRSIFNYDFNSKRKRILEDNQDYDLK